MCKCKSNSIPRRMRATRLILAGALVTAFCSTSQAALLTDTFNFTEIITKTGFNTATPKIFIDFAPSLDQFNPALGTLNSASVSWNVTGHIRMFGNLEGQAVLSYNGRSASKNADTDGSPPNDVDFSFVDSVSLSSALVEGTGTFNGGDSFVGTVANVGGTFPWGASLHASGRITVTYDYTPVIRPPGGNVPEPGSLALMGLGMIAGLCAVKRSRQSKA